MTFARLQINTTLAEDQKLSKHIIYTEDKGFTQNTKQDSQNICNI